MTFRILAYVCVLVLLLCALGFTIARRTDTQTTLFRAPGSQYIENKDGTVSNIYTFKIFNKTNHVIKPRLQLDAPGGKLMLAGVPDLTLEPAGMSEGTLFVSIPKTALHKRKTIVKFSVYQGSQKLEHFETTFMAPEE